MGDQAGTRLGNSPVLAAVLGAGCIAFSGILVRLADVSPDTAAVFRCLYALPALGLIAWLERKRYGPRSWHDRRIAYLAGAFFALDLIFWHRSIIAVGAGLATVLGNLQVVFVGLVAWRVLGEKPSARLFAAVPVVLIGIVLISGIMEEGAYGADPVLGTVYGVLTALAYTAFVLLLRQANRDLRRPAGPLFDATLTATVLSAVGGLILRDLEMPGAEAHGWLVTLALSSQVLGWLLISVSLPRLPAAVTSVVIMLQPVGSVFLAMVLIDETPSALQLLGVALVLAGVAAVALAQRRPMPVPEPAG